MFRACQFSTQTGTTVWSGCSQLHLPRLGRLLHPASRTRILVPQSQNHRCSPAKSGSCLSRLGCRVYPRLVSRTGRHRRSTQTCIDTTQLPLLLAWYSATLAILHYGRYGAEAGLILGRIVEAISRPHTAASFPSQLRCFFPLQLPAPPDLHIHNSRTPRYYVCSPEYSCFPAGFTAASPRTRMQPRNIPERRPVVAPALGDRPMPRPQLCEIGSRVGPGSSHVIPQSGLLRDDGQGLARAV